MDLLKNHFFPAYSLLAVFLCLLLSCFLVLTPARRRIANLFLAGFLALTALELSGWLWIAPGQEGRLPDAIRQALGLLQMPLFLGFYLASCYSDFRLRSRDAAHLIPMLAALTLALPGVQIGAGLTEAGPALTAREQDLLIIAAHLVYYAYMAGVVATLLHFWRQYRMQHSGGRSATLIWLTQLAAVSLFAHTLVLVRTMAGLTQAQDLFLGLQVFGAVLTLGILTWITLTSLLRPELFRGVDRRLLALSDPPSDDGRPGLDELLSHMSERRPFLDPDLTLARLSDQVAMTPREVSELINQSAGVHFFDFVNGYRIQHAQSLLISPERPAITEVMHASGFNSKSSFNTAFKKHAGMTPSAYRSGAA
jgi:AraC-like DNA-binding protein